jgi:glycosyltransferase involved in cell wall biosynthesis
MISFIVPAHNEERWIDKCLSSIRTSMEKLGEPYELIVVDDASTDATRKIAEQAGARTFQVECRKVSAVRNAGAREARGEMFFFVDADTQVNEQAVGAALAAVRSGAAGGGCVFDFDGAIPFWARLAHSAGCVAGRLVRWVGGCFLFCTREAYSATGGFAESLAVGEDIAFCQAIKKVGRFVVPGPVVVTSSRKIGVVTPWEVLRLMLTIIVRGPNYQSEWALDLLYGQRARDSREPGGAAS